MRLNKFILISILLLSSCKFSTDGIETASHIKQASNAVSSVASDNESQAKAIIELTDKQQVKKHAGNIIDNSKKLHKIAIDLNKDANEVLGLSEELKKANSESNRLFNIVITGLIAFFIIASVASWVVFNSKKGVIGGILGVFICLSITWFYHHIGIVIGGFAILIIGYFIYKKRNDTHKELIENIQFAKDLIPKEDKEKYKAHLNNNQSCNTKLTVSKNKQGKL